ncbi:MAG: indolepyruvate oxidoreductase subunit beta [Candidatus Korarchaeota archaeon]|nr:indolepyruvate oxidoreductase subunit beta [Candidatus Korarchaeota archaeon]
MGERVRAGKAVFQMLVAGVGGQGSVLISHVIADAAIRSGYRVRVGEKFGAAMRGGAVSSHIRMFREGDLAPLIPEGEADAVMALEPLEGLRISSTYLRPGGVVVMNVVPVYPMDVNAGWARYPDVEAIVEGLKGMGAEVYTLNATDLAIQAGTAKAMNSVVLGAFYATGVLPIDRGVLLEALMEGVPEGTQEVNRRAFELGERSVR